MKRRKLTALLCASLMACVFFAGCGDNGTTPPDAPNSAGSTDAADGSAKDGGAAKAEDLKPVTLHFYLFDGKKADTDKVWSAIGEQYQDQLNATFDVQFIAGTDFKQKMLVKAASGDKWDLNFDADWVGYYQMIAKDAYMNLDELLPQYAPDLYKAYQDNGVLEAAKSKGHIVALPWTMSMSQRPFYQWRGDLAKAAGIEVDPATVKTLEDAEALMYQLHDAYPDRHTIEVAGIEQWQLKYNLSAISHYYVFDLSDSGCKVTPIEQTPAYLEMAKAAKKWQDDGLIWKDILTDKLDHNQLIDQGLLISKWGTHEYANSTRAWAEEGAYWDSNPLYEDNLWANRTPLANAACIPRTSENPERTLMFLNLLETDQTLYDMVHYGILGETYNLENEAAVYPEGMTAANSSYMDWGGRWAFWKPQFMRPDATYGKDFWIKEAEYVKSNPKNVVSPLDGFNFEVEAVKTEIAQRDQIYDDANKMISVGLGGDPDTAVANLIEQEKKAGTDKITEELQKQIDAFLAAK